ncbi:hypothetical protein B0H19DRAFT_971344, partial [Mycena capillaripes]
RLLSVMTSTNWFHPFLMIKADWSPSLTVKRLQKRSPMYKSLGKGTISRWRITGEKKWTQATLDRISAGKAIPACGRTGILAPYPEITTNVKETLQGLRSAGAIVNVSIARGLLIAKITEDQPQLLTKFKVSEKYVRTFFASVMVGRRARQHDKPVISPRTLLLC